MPPLGDYKQYECPHCGAFRVSGTVEQLIKNGVGDPRVAHIVEHDGYRCLME